MFYTPGFLALLLHARAPQSVDVALGITELLPAVAIVPFMLYQLARFGTLHFLVPKPVNRVVDVGILVLIVASTIANRQGAYGVGTTCGGLLVAAMAIVVLYGVLTLRQMQSTYDAHCPPKAAKRAGPGVDREPAIAWG